MFGRGTLIVPKYLLVFERTERETRDIQSPSYKHTNFIKYGKEVSLVNYVIFQSPEVTSCTTRFNIKKFYVLPTQRIYPGC